MKIKIVFLLTLTILTLSCNPDEPVIEQPTNNSLYFPPTNSDTWETSDANNLGWNTSYLPTLLSYVESKGTKAFLILKDGKIVVEWYGNGSDANSNLAWNSAAKTLVAFTAGIAQEEGYLDIDNASNTYLGTSWSSLTAPQEDNITVKHHLTMSTGLDYTVLLEQNCTDPGCFNYLNEPGTVWYYHNGAYTILHDIVAGALGSDFNPYFYEKIRDKIGMQGYWIPFGDLKLYYSNARSMARFALLNLNKGVWGETTILSDTTYFDEMTNTSQNMNKAYGYLWWLNGKESFRGPGLTLQFQGKLIPNAPNDLIAGLGKNDQKMYIVPSEDLIVIRMGDDAGEALLGPSSFDNELWGELNNFFN